MASAKRKNVACKVGGKNAAGGTEYLSTAFIISGTAETVVEPGTPGTIGATVLVDGEVQPDGRVVAVRVRPFAPTPEEIAKFKETVGKLQAVGFKLDFGDPEAFLKKTFEEQLGRGLTSTPELQKLIVEKLASLELRFPQVTWNEDPAPGLEEMSELLYSAGLPAVLLPSTDDIAAKAEARAKGNEQKFIRYGLALITQAANAALKDAGDPRRLRAFADVPWDEDPVWMFVTPEQRAALLATKLLEEPKGIEAEFDPKD